MTTMDFNATLNTLRKLCVETGSLACLGCGHENNCSIHGCAILRNAIEHMEAALANYDNLSALVDRLETELKSERLSTAECVSRVKELDELYTKLQAVTGFTAERLLELFAAGYTLEKPDYEKSMQELANLADTPPPNEPLTQADINKMHFDRVWIDYGVDDSGERCGEDGVILYGKLYSIDMLDGSAFEDLLLDACDGETLDRPSGDYTVYRRLPEAKDNNVPTNEPLTLEQLREMDGEPAWWDDGDGSCWGIISVDSAGMWGGMPFFRGRWREVNFEYNIEERKMKIYRRPPEGDADHHG